MCHCRQWELKVLRVHGPTQVRDNWCVCVILKLHIKNVCAGISEAVALRSLSATESCTFHLAQESVQEISVSFTLDKLPA